jgi:hypothetical protein
MFAAPSIWIETIAEVAESSNWHVSSFNLPRITAA